MKVAFLGNFGVSYSSETHHSVTLTKLGATVYELQEGKATLEEVLETALECDLFIWVHTHGWTTPAISGFSTMTDVLQILKQKGIPTLTYHLDLWLGISRERDLITDPFYRHIGHFFTADKLMAEWFNTNTEVKGHYLPAGVFEDEVETLPPSIEPKKDIIFVGSKGYHPEWTWRPILIDWLHDTYGHRFEHWGGDGLGIVRGRQLNQLYADTKVVVGDSLVKQFSYPYYWSDRVYETIGRGGFLLMPEIEGLREEFAEDELPFFKFGNFADIKKQIDFYMKNDTYREAIRVKAFNRVKNNYTYTHRWKSIFEELGL